MSHHHHHSDHQHSATTCLIIIEIVIQVITSLEYNYMITYTCFIIDLNYDHIQQKSDHDEQERYYEVVLHPVLIPLSR